MMKNKENNEKEAVRKKEDKEIKWMRIFRNPWRLAFIVLVAILIGFSSLVMYRISTPRTTYDSSAKTVKRSEKPIFDINMEKEQVNEVINFFMEDMMEESGVDYQFVLDSQAMVDGTFNLLGHETHFYLFFEPYVLSDGNIQLKAKSLSIGALNIPIPAMINYLSSTTDLPSWIELDADAQVINLHLDKYKMKNGMSIKAKKINLIDDEISFSIYLPKDTTKEKETSK